MVASIDKIASPSKEVLARGPLPGTATDATECGGET